MEVEAWVMGAVRMLSTETAAATSAERTGRKAAAPAVAGTPQQAAAQPRLQADLRIDCHRKTGHSACVRLDLDQREFSSALAPRADIDCKFATKT